MSLGAFKAALMGTAGVSTGDVVLLTSTTGSGVSEIEFTSKITSTYGEYIFKFYNINAAVDEKSFSFIGSINGGTDYGTNTVITSAGMVAEQDVAGSTTELIYNTSGLAQSTAIQLITSAQGDEASTSSAGEMHLFSPANTTYVKHFYIRTTAQVLGDGRNRQQQRYVGGYFNTTSAVNAIKFAMNSGNFDGTIKMWGVK